MNSLLTCKPGSEPFLAKEVALYDGSAQVKGQGLLFADKLTTANLCFACNILKNPAKVTSTSINHMADQLADLYIKHITNIKIVKRWPCQFFLSENPSLIPRIKTVEKCWQDKLLKKIPRVAKLAFKAVPREQDPPEGFYVYFTDFNEAYVSFEAVSLGQQRMQMDPQAPSRSYLKLEEAFLILGRTPKKGETVYDLGASPGGWSYSALACGANVFAVDNGPLKDPVKTNPKLTHLKVDALKFNYTPHEPADWLLCDILDQPEFTLDLTHRWVTRKWCRNFIVNVKLSRNNPITLIKEINDPKKGLRPFCSELIIRQLYHDREEITLMGMAKI